MVEESFVTSGMHVRNESLRLVGLMARNRGRWICIHLDYSAAGVEECVEECA
jgi:hypothetical protein